MKVRFRTRPRESLLTLKSNSAENSFVVTLSKRYRSKEQNDSENGDTSDDFHVNLLLINFFIRFCELKS